MSFTFLIRFLQGFEQVITGLLQVCYTAFTWRLQNCSNFFTMFPHICLQCFLQGFDNVLYKAFTMLWQGFYKVFSMLLQGLYKAFNCFYKAFTRLLQGPHKVFTMCVTRFLQGVYKVVYKAFTMCFTQLSQYFPYVLYNGFLLRGFFTMFLFFDRVLQDCYSAFIRLLLGFNKVLTAFSKCDYKAFHKAFRECLHCVFYQSLRRLLEIFWRAFRRLLEISQTVITVVSQFKYLDIPHQAAKSYLYLCMEDTQKVEW